MNTTTKTTAAAVALIAALILTGCSSADVFSGEPKPAPVATEAATPAAPIDGDENGDGKLSEREKELIAKRSYVLLDGTVVPTPKLGEPIPEAIIENIRAQGTAAAANLATSSASNADIELMEVVAAEQKRLARTIIMVNAIVDGSCDCTMWQVWTLNGPVVEPVSSRDAAVAAANAHAATNPKFQVIVFE